MSMTRLNPTGMSRVIGGKRYTVKTSTKLADDDAWDGNNFTKSGRNHFLYKTAGGAFFEVEMTCWQGERDMITPLERTEAIERFEALPEHYVEWAEAFDEEPTEAEAPGRPTFFGEAMKQTSMWLPQSMLDWLKGKPEGAGATLRSLVKTAMEK